MDIHLITYYIGILIIFVLNIYILSSSKSNKTITSYAYMNILAGLLIAYYFMYKEKFIDF
jgi:hypothetical protein